MIKIIVIIMMIIFIIIIIIVQQTFSVLHGDVHSSSSSSSCRFLSYATSKGDEHGNQNCKMVHHFIRRLFVRGICRRNLDRLSFSHCLHIMQFLIFNITFREAIRKGLLAIHKIIGFQIVLQDMREILIY